MKSIPNQEEPLGKNVAAVLVTLALIMEFLFPDFLVIAKTTNPSEYARPTQNETVIFIQDVSIRASNSIPLKKTLVAVSAYSSTPDQTDGNPFITASGTYVREGVIAANFLPFGTKVVFPHIYPDKIFVVEDRMASRFWKKSDIWFPNKKEAERFGVIYTEMIII